MAKTELSDEDALTREPLKLERSPPNTRKYPDLGNVLIRRLTCSIEQHDSQYRPTAEAAGWQIVSRALCSGE